MNTPEPIQPIYLVDSQSNLHIQSGEQRMVLPPAGALELIKFLERTQYVQNANVSTKGAQA